MISDNVMGADNQQERLDKKWIVGFVDGEGCFHVSINKIKKMKLGWQVLPEFRVVQHENDSKVLYMIQEYFGFGQVTQNRSDHHGVRLEYRVRGMDNLNRIVDFFSVNSLQTPSKSRNFILFSKIIEMMNQKLHLNEEGLREIALLVSEMNTRPRIRYLESSETTRRTSLSKDEDIVRPSWRHEEVVRNNNPPSNL